MIPKTIPSKLIIIYPTIVNEKLPGCFHLRGCRLTHFGSCFTDGFSWAWLARMKQLWRKDGHFIFSLGRGIGENV